MMSFLNNTSKLLTLVLIGVVISSIAVIAAPTPNNPEQDEVNRTYGVYDNGTIQVYDASDYSKLKQVKPTYEPEYVTEVSTDNFVLGSSGEYVVVTFQIDRTPARSDMEGLHNTIHIVNTETGKSVYRIENATVNRELKGTYNHISVEGNTLYFSGLSYDDYNFTVDFTRHYVKLNTETGDLETRIIAGNKSDTSFETVF